LAEKYTVRVALNAGPFEVVKDAETVLKAVDLKPREK